MGETECEPKLVSLAEHREQRLGQVNREEQSLAGFGGKDKNLDLDAVEKLKPRDEILHTIT